MSGKEEDKCKLSFGLKMSREETISETKVWSPKHQWKDNIKLDLKEMWYCLLYINNFRHLKNAVRRKHPENGESIVGFTFKTMLQHHGRFWSRISYRRILRQQWSIPLHSPDLVNFTYSFDWNQRLRDGSFMILLIYLKMRQKSWKGFHILVSKKAE